MNSDLNIHRFRELKAQATDVLGLRQDAQMILARRSLRTFDGFGHFLDAVLGDDEQRVEALALTARLSTAMLDQLRASELDPFAASFENVAYVGFLLGIDTDEFVRLADIDHSRFARHSESVLARTGTEATRASVERVHQLWARFEEDRGTAL
jgi:hypothetical protein